MSGVQQPPAQPRLPLRVGAELLGSVCPQWAQKLVAAWPQLGALTAGLMFQKKELPALYGYVFETNFSINLTDLFARVALAVRAAGLGGAWRNERLPVANDTGHTLAQVERGVVRVLGLRTQAVHLVGLRPDGAVWVQQRSFSKPNDPGLWDTLMGGTVAGVETVGDTLTRETWEEAGLHLAALADVTHHGHFTATRPVPDGGGAGFLVEDTHWYTATVPWGLEPVNQDGEVDHFECWPPAQVRQAVAQGRFTPEAAWVLGQVLGP